MLLRPLRALTDSGIVNKCGVTLFLICTSFFLLLLLIQEQKYLRKVSCSSSSYQQYMVFSYYFSKALIPGRVLPSRNSREAPPPVETWLILSARPNLLIAATESPPPTTLVASLSASALATSPVPLLNASNSKKTHWTVPYYTLSLLNLFND